MIAALRSRLPCRLAAVPLLALLFLTGLKPASPRDPPAHWHIDRPAGVKFVVPFHPARELSPKEGQALATGRLGARLALPDVSLTTALAGKDDLPLLFVWTRPLAMPLTREAADRLAQGDPAALKAAGVDDLWDFRFDVQRLLGEAPITVNDAVHGRLLVQLVKNRYTYLAYLDKAHASSAAVAFASIKRSLAPGRLSRLNYAELPSEPPASEGLLRKVLWGLAVIGALAALICIAYWRIAGRPERGRPSRAPAPGPLTQRGDGRREPEIHLPS